MSIRQGGDVSSPSPAPLNRSDSIDPSGTEAAVPRRGTRGWMTESGLVVVKWSNWGKRRFYVNTLDDRPVGWLDRDSGERSLDLPELASEFEAAVEEAATLDDRVGSSPRRTFVEPAVDLSARRPGEHLEAHIAATVEAGRELKPAVTGFEGKRAYSSWELGVLGEQAVAQELARLVDLDPRWSFLNSIPVGTHKSDIDHLVIGPGGVFTINTKHHHGGTVWVAEGACNVNNSWQHYVENSRSEAERASSLLGAAAGIPVAVTGLVVLVGVVKLTVKAQPVDVQVLDQAELVTFLTNRPFMLDEDVADLVLNSARLGCTWR